MYSVVAGRKCEINLVVTLALVTIRNNIYCLLKKAEKSQPHATRNKEK